MSPHPIRFYYQGRVHAVDDVAPTRTVLEHLRETLHCNGTKEGCAEGDCGACTVVMGTPAGDHPPPAGAARVDGLDLLPVNACLMFLPALDGRALFTVEDLRADDGGLHPVQQSMVDCHGSQCGFCTPGFVMTLWHLYEQRGAQGVPGPAALGDALAGNLCRCTGYRPIREAAQRMFELPAARMPLAAAAAALADLQRPAGLDYTGPAGERFSAPRSTEALAQLLAQRPGARLFAGATDVALWVNKQRRVLDDLVYLGHVPALQTVQRADGWLQLGAAVPLETAWSALTDAYPTLAEVWKRFAAPPVRHAGTLGGNLANGSPIGDGAPVLMALGALLTLRSAAGERRVALEDFYLGYMRNDLRPGEWLHTVSVPLPVAQQTVAAYKISKRFDSDISALCLAVSLQRDGQGMVQDVRIACGGMAATVRRAPRTEQAVRSAAWTEATVQAAIQALAEDFQPLSDLRGTADYRLTVAGQLLYRFFLATHGATPMAHTALSVWPIHPVAAEPTAPRSVQAAVAALAAPHESAHLHVTGRAHYTDDQPELAGTLYAALGLSTQAHAHITALCLDKVRAMPDVVDVFAAADLPAANNVGPIVHDDPILADGTVHYVGQPVFAVIARSVQAARRAALLAADGAVVTYAPLPALLTPEAAHAAGQYVAPPMHLRREQAPGALQAALDAAPHRLRGTWSLGGQEHFYLEGQIAYAMPQDDHGMLVACGTQHPTEMQHVVAEALGVHDHAVRVECRRMGGGFGGKESQSALFACVAAVAARRLGRPVKLRVDRDDDFAITGRRHCFRYAYDVGYDDAGRILGADLTMVSRAGFSADLSKPVMVRAMQHVDNAYWLPNVAVHGYSARTNTASNTAFRGFGGPQGALLAEHLVDAVAHALGRDALDVRRANFYAGTAQTTPYGQVVADNIIEPLVERLAQQADYAGRRAAVQRFNSLNAVLKKGLALTPVKFGIAFNVTASNQAGALVHVYTDGTVLVNHGGTEMGQGLNTKVAQVVAQALGLPLDRVRCSATDTSKIPNTSPTAASTGSDLNGMAALDAARTIRQRLAHFAADTYGIAEDSFTLADGVASSTDGAWRMPWPDLVRAAYQTRVQLWSDGFYATPGIHWDGEALQGSPFQYFSYGAALSEVIVDTLTGEWHAVRSDVLFDTGSSINTAVDLGQIEGAFAQGMGWLTTEELFWHPETGRLMTHAPSTYKIPTANDMPAEFNVWLYGEPNRAATVHRSKAVGEPPILLPFSVFFALRDAVSAAGGHAVAPPLAPPATGEAVLQALQHVRAMAAARRAEDAVAEAEAEAEAS